MSVAITESLSTIQTDVLAIIGQVAPVALAIVAGFIGLRLALRAFRKVGS